MKTSVMSAAVLTLVISAGTATAGGVRVASGDINGDGQASACESAPQARHVQRPGKPGRRTGMRTTCNSGKAQPRRHCMTKPGYKAPKGDRPAAGRMVRADYCGNGTSNAQSSGALGRDVLISSGGHDMGN